MKNRFTGFHTSTVAALAISASLSVALFALYVLLQAGSYGLLEWMPSYRNIFLQLLSTALIPLLLLIPARFSKIMKAVSLCISLFFIAGILVASIVLFSVVHTIPKNTPRLNKLSISSPPPLRRLAFSSDPHFGSGRNNLQATTSILRTINSEKFDAFFILGDIGEMGVPGSDFDMATDLLAKELPDVPFATVMGNHDALIGGSYRYHAFFNKQLYYRVDSGTTHIIALNALWGTESITRKQKKWLEETLASIPEADTTIVLSHCFFYASGYTDEQTNKDWFDHRKMIDSISPILEKGSVDLVISGHNHFMEYLENPKDDGTKGTAYVIIGSMGGAPDPERQYISRQSLWYKTEQFGYLDLSIFEDHMELTFRDEYGKALHTVIR